MISMILDLLFFGFCGWVGRVTVKVVTFGKVELDDGDSSGSILTECLGAGVLLALAMIVSLILNAD